MAKGKMKEIKLRTANGMRVLTSALCPQDKMYRIYNSITRQYVYIIHPQHEQYVPWDKQWVWVEPRVRRILRQPRRPPLIYKVRPELASLRKGRIENVAE